MDKNSTKTNGKASQGEGKTAVKELTKPEASSSVVGEKGQFNEQALQPETTPTVEDRIKKIFTLNDRIETRSLLKSHLERVEAIKFGDYDEKDSISIVNATGKPYVIKSTNMCKKISAMLKEEITAKIVEVEAQIIF